MDTNLVYVYSLPLRATSPVNRITLDFTNSAVLHDIFESRSSSLCNILNVASPLLGPS